MIYDLRNASFDEFVDFVFDRPVAYVHSHGFDHSIEDVRNEEPWYGDYESEFLFNGESCVSFCTTIFEGPLFLLKKFTPGQLEQGFWALGHCDLPIALRALLYDEAVDIELRKDCVEAMYSLYRDLFSVNHLGNSAWMWWHSIAW